MLRDTARNDLVSQRRFPSYRFNLPSFWVNILAVVAAVGAGLLVAFFVQITGSLSFIEALALGVLFIAPFGLIIAMRLLGDIRRLLVVALLFDLSLGININFFYNEVASSVSAIPGFTISVVTLSLLGLYTLWLLEHLTGRNHIPLRSLLASAKPLVFYILCALLSLVVASSWLLASFEINYLVQGLLLYMYIVYSVKTRRQMLFIVTLLVLGLGMQGTIMVGLKATGGTFDIGFLTAEPDPYGRLSGTVGGPNQSADFLVMWLALTFGMMLSPAPFGLKVVGAGAAMMAIAGLIFTFSRGGWIAFVIAVGLIGLISWRKGWLPLYVPFVVALLAAAVLIPLWPYIMERLFGDDNGSAESRLPLIRMALYIIRDHPLLGLGANNYIFALPEYVNSEFTATWIRVVHNKFLLVWAETGIFGLLTFIWFLWDTLARGWRVIQANDRYLSPLALGLTAALLGWIAHMQVALFHDSIQLYTLALAAGMLAAMEGMVRNEA